MTSAQILFKKTNTSQALKQTSATLSETLGSAYQFKTVVK